VNKKVLKIVGIVVGVALLLVIAVPFFINVNNYRPQIESNLSSALGRPVKVGNLSLSILSGSVEANQLSIADDPKFSNNSFIQAKSLKVGVELMPLIFSKQLNVTHLVIEQPQIAILRNREGVWNFSSLGNQAGQAPKTADKSGSSGSGNLSVDKLEIKDGTISLGSVPARRQPVTYDKLNAAVKNFSFTNSFPLTVSARLPGGGSMKLDGTAGPINATDTSLTPGQIKIELRKLDLSQSAIVSPGTGITGFADFDGTANSDGQAVKASGKLKGSSLKLVPKGSAASQPVEVTFTVEHNLKNETGQLQGDVAIGKAVAKISGTYDMQGETTVIRMKLNGESMPVDDLEGFLPAVGVQLPSGSKLKGGTLSANMDAVGPVDKVVATGSVRMSNTALAGFNLGSKLSALSSLTGKQIGGGNDTAIQNLSSDVRYAPDGTRLDKIDLVIPSLGTVTGAGTVSPSNELDFKMVANLSGGLAGELTKVAGMGSNSGGIPVHVTGTTSNPSFMPDVKGMVGNQLKGLVPTGKNNPVGNLGGLFGKKKKQ
jgi:AsmA protein